MRAVQLIEIEKDLENREVQTPKPQSDEVLVRIFLQLTIFQLLWGMRLLGLLKKSEQM